MRTNSSALVHRVTYRVCVNNTANQPLFNLHLFLAHPPPLPPRQNLISLKVTPSSGVQATDLIGNHWVDYSLERLPANGTTIFNYTALVRTLAVHYQLSRFEDLSEIPSNLAIFTRPENFIESHHHLIKDLAREIAKKNSISVNFVQAAMQVVSRALKYVSQKYERGAAFAIENGMGDCTEFSALLAALCRANKITARLMAGFAFNGQKWERHAWTQIWLNSQWVPTDPTWYGSSGWLGVTNRHIPLIIGNWMDTRIRQEFKLSWSQRLKTTAPKISTTWKVTRIIGLQSTV